MIKRIFDFRSTTARSALLPLVKVDAIEETATVADARTEFLRHRHSRIPVYADRIDNIVGVLDFFDLLGAKDPKQTVRSWMRRPEYVADSQSLPDVLVQLVGKRQEVAVVVDEHGGAVGILTTEDIFEEIAGEISDEYDSESLPFRIVDDNKWIIHARMEIVQINEQMKLALPEGDYETLAGFLLRQFGRIPQPQDELYFNTRFGMLKFTIRLASDRHVESVLVERVGPAPASDSPGPSES
jgi:CBS domain containing-hemolysin-like protein